MNGPVVCALVPCWRESLLLDVAVDRIRRRPQHISQHHQNTLAGKPVSNLAGLGEGRRRQGRSKDGGGGQTGEEQRKGGGMAAGKVGTSRKQQNIFLYKWVRASRYFYTTTTGQYPVDANSSALW